MVFINNARVLSPRSAPLSPRDRNDDFQEEFAPDPASFQFTEELAPAKKTEEAQAVRQEQTRKLGRKRKRANGVADSEGINVQVHEKENLPPLPTHTSSADWKSPQILGNSEKLRHGKHVRVEVNGQWKNAKVLASTSLFVTLKFQEDGSIATVPLGRPLVDDTQDCATKEGSAASWVQLAVTSPATAGVEEDVDMSDAAAVVNEVAPVVRAAVNEVAPVVRAAAPTVQDWDRRKFEENIRWVQAAITRVFDEKKFNSNIRYVQKLLQSYGARFDTHKPATPNSKQLYGDRHQFAFCMRSPRAPPIKGPE